MLGLGLGLVGREMYGRVCMGTYMHVCVHVDTCVHVVLPGHQSLTLTLNPSRPNIFDFFFLFFLDRGGV